MVITDNSLDKVKGFLVGSLLLYLNFIMYG
ncbi:MAG: hypothetical protein JWR72_3253 [Flavisolibacter sp.]|nr:hypothetical protein [Flavisolibacter sp.]